MFNQIGRVAKWYRVVLLSRRIQTEVVGSSPIPIDSFCFILLVSTEVHLGFPLTQSFPDVISDHC